MDSLLYGSTSPLHKTGLGARLVRLITNVGTSSVATTEQVMRLITAPAMILVRRHKKSTCNCCATDQESLSLPIEIMVEIFCRLDAQTLLKLKTLCKKWRALIEDPNFVEEHANRASLVRQEEAEETFKHDTSYNGLILEGMNNGSKTKCRVRNPTIRGVFDLPDPHENTKNMQIAYAPASCCYKVISVQGQKYKTKITGIEVLTLGCVDQPSWRSVDASLLRNLCERYDLVWTHPFKGVVHFYPEKWLQSKDFEMVSLDMDKECFTSTMLPRRLFPDSETNLSAIGYSDDRNLRYLSLAESVNDGLRLLVLEDYKKGKWAEAKITIPLISSKENTNMTNARPYWASQMQVCFLINGETKIYYIKSHQMTNTKPPTSRKTNIFYAKDTLATFKGMRLEEN